MAKSYALIRKTFPPRRTPRRTYCFVALLKNWGKYEEHNLVAGGPRYELVATLTAERAADAARKAREMYTGWEIMEREML